MEEEIDLEKVSKKKQEIEEELVLDLDSEITKYKDLSSEELLELLDKSKNSEDFYREVEVKDD